MDGHHRIEEKGKVNTLGFYGKLEGFGITIKRQGRSLVAMAILPSSALLSRRSLRVPSAVL
jgi:hypothetical protein